MWRASCGLVHEIRFRSDPRRANQEVPPHFVTPYRPDRKNDDSPATNFESRKRPTVDIANFLPRRATKLQRYCPLEVLGSALEVSLPRARRCHRISWFGLETAARAFFVVSSHARRKWGQGRGTGRELRSRNNNPSERVNAKLTCAEHPRLLGSTT